MECVSLAGAVDGDGGLGFSDLERAFWVTCSQIAEAAPANESGVVHIGYPR